MEPIKRTALAAALAAAQKQAKAVQQDGHNQTHGYKYASAEAIIEESRDALSAHGLSLVRVASVLHRLPEPIEHVATNRRGETQAFRIPALYQRTDLLLHEGGESLTLQTEWPIIPEAGRPFDKATAAADTASLGYLLRDLLLLPRVEKGTGLDDDDRDHGHDHPQWRTPDQERTILGLMRDLAVKNEDRGALVASILVGADPRTFASATALIVALQERKAKALPAKSEVAESKSDPTAQTVDGSKHSAPPSASASSATGSVPPTGTSASPPDSGKGKKRSATAALLAFKAQADAATDAAGMDNAWALHAEDLAALTKRALAIAEGYARARRAEIGGSKPAPADDALALQLNELAKE